MSNMEAKRLDCQFMNGHDVEPSRRCSLEQTGPFTGREKTEKSGTDELS